MRDIDCKIDERCKNCPLVAEPYVHSILHRDSDILFLGRDPGEVEVYEDEPFVGPAGQIFRPRLARLLKRVRKYGMELVISISNIRGCRPPGNKAPTKKEWMHCIPRLKEIIHYTNPKLIVCFGKVAAGAILGLAGVLKYNGDVFESKEGLYKGPVVVVVHPSYCLHQGGNEKPFEDGFRTVLTYYDPWPELDYKAVDTLKPIAETVAMDIETSAARPHEGCIRSFAVSDGIKSRFIDLEKDGE